MFEAIGVIFLALMVVALVALVAAVIVMWDEARSRLEARREWERRKRRPRRPANWNQIVGSPDQGTYHVSGKEEGYGR